MRHVFDGATFVISKKMARQKHGVYYYYSESVELLLFIVENN